MRFKTKGLIKKIGLVSLGISVLGLAAVGITNLVNYLKQDKESIHPTFELGGLNAQGRYEETKESIYTKDKFACDGLQATLDFDAQINYQIFYYDILDNFISSTEVLTDGYGEETPINGAYARIEITPTNDGDGKISFSERLKYGNQLNLKVTKNADSNVLKKYVSFNGNLFTIVENFGDAVYELGKHWDGEKIVVEASSGTNYNCCTSNTIVKVNGGEKLKFDFSKLGGVADQTYGFTIYEYTDIKDGAKFTTKECMSQSSAPYEVTLSKNTSYCIISVSSNKTLAEIYSNCTKVITC